MFDRPFYIKDFFLNCLLGFGLISLDSTNSSFNDSKLANTHTTDTVRVVSTVRRTFNMQKLLIF